MELSRLIEHPITATFSDKGEEVVITFNGNWFTPAFMRKVAQKMRETVKHERSGKTGTLAAKKGRGVDSTEATIREMEATAARLELEQKVFAGFLACDQKDPILVDWDVTENGEPVKPTLALLLRLNPRTVIGIWQFCLSTVNPKEQATQPITPKPTISETIGDTLPTDSVANQTM